VQPNQVEIESEGKSNGTRSSLKFLLTRDDDVGARIQVQMKQGGVVSRLKFGCPVLLTTTLADHTLGFQDGIDDANVVHKDIYRTRASWQALSCSDQTVSDGNGGNTTAKKCVLATTDNKLAIEALLSGDIFAVGAAKVRPDAVKVTVKVNPTLTGAEYAVLGCFFQSSSAAGHRDDSDTSSTGSRTLNFGTGQTFFSWENQAIDNNGVGVNVIASPVIKNGTHPKEGDEDDDQQQSKMYFTFDETGATSFLWDPQVSGDTLSGNSAATVTGSLLLVAGFLFSLLFL